MILCHLSFFHPSQGRVPIYSALLTARTSITCCSSIFHGYRSRSLVAPGCRRHQGYFWAEFRRPIGTVRRTVRIGPGRALLAFSECWGADSGHDIVGADQRRAPQALVVRDGASSRGESARVYASECIPPSQCCCCCWL